MDGATRSFDFDVLPISGQSTGLVNLHDSETLTADPLTTLKPRKYPWRGIIPSTNSLPGNLIDIRTDRRINAIPYSIQGNWSRIALASLSSEMYGKIRRIARREDGWRGPGSRALSADALRGFLDFWAAIKLTAREPVLALTANGGMEAHWYKSSKKHLDLSFRDNQRIFFGLIDGANIHEGVDAPTNVINLLTKHNSKPLLWN